MRTWENVAVRLSVTFRGHPPEAMRDVVAALTVVEEPAPGSGEERTYRFSAGPPGRPGSFDGEIDALIDRLLQQRASVTALVAQADGVRVEIAGEVETGSCLRVAPRQLAALGSLGVQVAFTAWCEETPDVLAEILGL
ncbi:hypothetical protein V1J52_08330 [Streptomyces sp. TRM 70351]|uniref:hypothetical protein n=1 Tax=Streptomyces sp. TRM 70351 TaxID=3116552 RepID=UPI002E7AB67D|nr:hypothetical protein [Streptomyces sp. TRM 70351]MEE1928200.1 hypothetical protein [Streptomyces sp. TRM 70351]